MTNQSSQQSQDLKEFNSALMQRGLDSIESRGFRDRILSEGCGELSFFQICGISKFWDENSIESPIGMMEKVLSGIAENNMIFVLLLTGGRNGICLRVGVSSYSIEAAESAVRSVYKGCELNRCSVSDLAEYNGSFGGVVVGCPSLDNAKKSQDKPADNLSMLSRAMLGSEFCFVTIARGLSPVQTAMARDRALDMIQDVNARVRKTLTGGHLANESVQLTDFSAQELLTNLRLLEKIIEAGCSTGLWAVCSYFAVKKRDDYQRISNAIKMTFGGSTSKPQRIRCIQMDEIGRVISSLQMLTNIDPMYHLHPIGAWKDPKTHQDVNLFVFQFRNILDSTHLAAMTAIMHEEHPGFYVDDYVAFDTSVRKLPERESDRLILGQIMQAGREDIQQVDNPYLFDVMDLNRHGLIIGITGGGKTNTSKYLLGELWRKHHKPFLVIESAKREYWELMNLPGFQNLLLFTLGSEEPGRSIRYRINPFEVIGTVSLQTHIDYLLSTFKAAFELYPPMPYVLETSVYEVYKDRGWDIVTNANQLGLHDYPTLTDLYRKIDIVTDSLGYHQEAKENTKAALKARINSLRIGGKGAMMDTRYSVPIEKLLSTPAVLELEDLGDDDTKAFVIGMLLVQLYEYRKSTHRSGQAKLIHLVMIEEAHRLLKRIPEGGESANPRAKSVEFFCNLLAEIRSFGQGFLIADQIPTKLASDTVKNTNLKIVHRVVMEEDREAIGKSMHMSDEQINYLSSLRRGYAAVYSEGDNHPKMIRFPLVKNDNNKQREEVISLIRRNVDSIIGEYDISHNYHFGCTYCEEQCIYRDKVSELIRRAENIPQGGSNRFTQVCNWLSKGHFSLSYLNGTVNAICKPNKPESFFESVCIIGYVLEHCNLSDGDKARIMSNFIKNRRRTSDA